MGRRATRGEEYVGVISGDPDVGPPAVLEDPRPTATGVEVLVRREDPPEPRAQNLVRDEVERRETAADLPGGFVSITRATPWLRPRVHGNGFVQLDLVPDGSRRLHIWNHPDIPRQTTRSDIHDHVFTMHAHVLVGRMVNILWYLRDSDRPTHGVYRAEYGASGSDSQLIFTGRRGCPEAHSTIIVGDFARNREYMVYAGSYHSSLPDGPTATLMTKIVSPRPRRSPYVLVPLGAEPDNAFSRHAHDQSLLWRIIEEVYPRWPELLRS